MKSLLTQWASLVSVTVISTACVNLPQPMAKADVRSIATIASKNKVATIEVGKATKQDVLEQFGPTRSVSFDSGFEVWAYQIKYEGSTKPTWVQRLEKIGSDKGVLGNIEVVLLFDPAGILSKKRMRYPTVEPD